MRTLKGIGGCMIGAVTVLTAVQVLRICVGLAPTPSLGGAVATLSVFAFCGVGLGAMIATAETKNQPGVGATTVVSLMLCVAALGFLWLAGVHLGWLDAFSALTMTALAGAAGGYGFNWASGKAPASEDLATSD